MANTHNHTAPVGALELLAELEQRGLHLQLRPDGNITVGPKQLLTEEVSNLIREHKGDLIYALMMREDADTPDTVITPAQSLIATCARLGIALRIDPDATLVVGTRGGPDIPATLARALTVHVDAVARLIGNDRDQQPAVAIAAA